MTRRHLLTLALLGYACTPWHAPLLSQPTESIVYVQQQHPLAADTNPGTRERPYATLHPAVQRAIANHAAHRATRVVIFPGVYRDTITLDFPAKHADAPLVLEAHEPGTVVLTGSDLWTAWRRHGTSPIYTHPWPHAWSLGPQPWADEHIILAPIVRRREMLFVDGVALTQVLSRAALRERSFYIAEAEGLVYVSWPGEPLSTRRVEVATRPHVLVARQAMHLTLRGLRFQHAASPVQESAVRFTDAEHITIDHCQFVWNNWAGLGLWDVAHVRITDSVANDNGGLGMVLWKGNDLLFMDNETSYNNWRGAQGGFYGWAVAGIKTLRLHQALYRRHKAMGNHARGFWIDYDHEHITLEEATVCDNALDGVFIEASQGPILVTKSTVCRNGRGAGLLSTNSSAVTLADNVIAYNGGPQLKITGDPERQVKNWQTGGTLALRTVGWSLTGNTMLGQTPEQPLLEVPLWPHFLHSLTGTNNLWYHPTQAHVFHVGPKRLDFAAWQALARQDGSSRFAAPDPAVASRAAVPPSLHP